MPLSSKRTANIKHLKFSERSTQRGYTLIELSVVVAIIGIMSTISVWQMRDYLSHYRCKEAALTFAKNVDRMRMIALKNNRESRICMDTYDSAPTNIEAANEGKYILSVGDKSLQSNNWDILPEDYYDDLSDDDQTTGTYDHSSSGKHYLKHISIGDWGSDIAGPHFGNGSCIVFSPRGYVLNPATDFNAQGFIEIQFINKLALDNGETDTNIVMIARSGMTRIDNSKGRINSEYFSGTAYDAANTDE